MPYPKIYLEKSYLCSNMNLIWIIIAVTHRVCVCVYVCVYVSVCACASHILCYRYMWNWIIALSTQNVPVKQPKEICTKRVCRQTIYISFCPLSRIVFDSYLVPPAPCSSGSQKTTQHQINTTAGPCGAQKIHRRHTSPPFLLLLLHRALCLPVLSVLITLPG